MTTPTLTLSILSGLFAVCRLHKAEAVPAWADVGEFVSITRTADELSIVCRQENLPEGVNCEAGWRCLKVDGPLDFALTGILAALAVPLAESQISLFTVATFDTDYLLVKDSQFAGALEALAARGHTIRR